MQLEATESGYRMIAWAIKDGKECHEIPVTIEPDGESRWVPGLPPAARAAINRPDPRTLEMKVEMDGKPLGHALYAVSEDGKTLTATVFGRGVKGPIKTMAVFDRE
jgi:hypothetical protein